MAEPAAPNQVRLRLVHPTESVFAVEACAWEDGQAPRLAKSDLAPRTTYGARLRLESDSDFDSDYESGLVLSHLT